MKLTEEGKRLALMALCAAIEKIPASSEATNASVLASNLSSILMDEHSAPQGWVSLKDRRPTQEDAGLNGMVVARYNDGTFDFIGWHAVAIHTRISHFHPIAKFQEDKLPPFGEWLEDKVMPDTDKAAEWFTARYAEYAALVAKERE